MTRSTLAALAFVLVFAASYRQAHAGVLEDQYMKTASKVLANTIARFDRGATTAAEVYGWSVRRMIATARAVPADKRQTDPFREHRDLMQHVSDRVKARHTRGMASSDELDEAAFYLAQAELWLANGFDYRMFG
jgi:hypothetical protein